MNIRPSPLVRRLLACLALAAVGVGLAGCLIIPTDYFAAGSRRNVSPRTVQVLQPGVTTKEDVLLVLGEPDSDPEDGRRLDYEWTKVKAIWFVGGYGAAIGGEIQCTNVLQVSFDASNRVSQVRLVGEWEQGEESAAQSRELRSPRDSQNVTPK